MTTAGSKALLPLSKYVVNDVEKFVFFIGYPRSGHSIIGSMMDAHPDMIIAHDFHFFKMWQHQPEIRSKEKLFNALYRNSVLDATSGWRTAEENRKGYTLHMDQSWQGRFRKLKVIGDKSGSSMIKYYMDDLEQAHRFYQEIVDTIKTPVRVLHVVRNPYDMIATQLLYRVCSERKQKVAASIDHPYSDTEKLYSVSKNMLERMNAVNRILKEWGLNVLELHNADHIRDPKGTMQQICVFLEVECSEDYLQQCYDKTFKTLSRSRELVVWSPEILKMVEEGTREFPYFHRYTFENEA